MDIKEICCIGAGYVGGPTMAVIALKCPDIKITVVDQDQDKIDMWNGETDNLPVYEPGLKEIINKVRGKNLFFSTNIDTAIDESKIIFIAVNTPTKTEGKGAGMAADLKYVESCTRNIAKVAKSDKIIVEKSTLPVRTAERIKEILDDEGDGINFDIISNPEFLAEGTAIQDLFKSDRVLIGHDQTDGGQNAANLLIQIYSNWIPREKIVTTNVWSSELAKLASNAMLAQRISSINSLSALCEKTGADITELSKAIGMDHRIGDKFLNASVGFGGSCFNKDILNLVYLCRHYGLEEVAEFWHQVIKINNYQRNRFSDVIIEELDGDINNKVITILGWAFKKDTNDSRESASIYISANLLLRGACLSIYDPMVSKSRVISDLESKLIERKLTQLEITKLLNKVKICSNHETAIGGSSAIAVLTEWDEFKNYKWDKIKSDLPNVKLFDGRNIISNTNYSIGK
jgi:UDPglucose 6-dehydrogenase